MAIGLGNTLTHPDCKLPEALSEMKRLAPGVEPQILVMTFTELAQSLNDGRVDLIIRGKYNDDRNFSYVPLYREVHRTYVAQSVELTKIRQLPLVYRPHPYVEQAINLGGTAVVRTRQASIPLLPWSRRAYIKVYFRSIMATL